MFHKIDLTIILATVFAINLTGCGTDNMNNVEIPVAAIDESSNDQITSTLPVQAVNDVSPASPQFQLPAADASPDIVAKKFLDFLNSEDQENFELLLTPVALNAVSRMNFQLPPIADPGTHVQCSQPSFATIRQKISFVSCVSESQDDNSVSEISLMLRKSKSGWRVAGMMLLGENPGEQNLLSFESISDLNQIKESVQFVDASAAPAAQNQ